jgi:hypothetical protein
MRNDGRGRGGIGRRTGSRARRLDRAGSNPAGRRCGECRWNYMLQEPEVVGSSPTGPV